MNATVAATSDAQGGQRSQVDSRRAELLKRTSRFRACWHELAEALSRCKAEGLYSQWGYASFEAYYRKELRLKASTVQRLVSSYGYLHRVAPEVLERDGVHEPIPSAESIDFLRRSDEAGALEEVSSELVEQVRIAVLEQGCSAGVLEKRFSALLFPELPALDLARNRREALRTTAQLSARLHRLRESLPAPVLAQAEQALEQLLQALQGPEAAALSETRPPDGGSAGAAAQAIVVDPVNPGASPPRAGAPGLTASLDGGSHPRVLEAHRAAVIYLCAEEQGADDGARRRLRKSLQWHLRILSTKRLYSLERLFPSGAWRRVVAAGAEDSALEPVLTKLFGSALAETRGTAGEPSERGRVHEQ